MFPSSYNLETFLPRMQSQQAFARATINLDFGRDSTSRPSQSHKKSSFLPDAWLEQGAETGDDVHKYTFLGASIFCPKQRIPLNKPREFCTGSKYIGNYNKLGMSGKGVYRFPHGVIYDGYFNKNGEFHGAGHLIYPGGQRVEGLWRNGKLVKGANAVTSDNIAFASQYCRMPDRRFQIEVLSDLNPASQEYLTNAPNPPRKIQDGCYDTGEGYYDPKRRILYDYTDSTKTTTLAEFANVPDPDQIEIYKVIMSNSAQDFHHLGKMRRDKIHRFREILSIPNDIKEKWIVSNCRKAWDEPTGYRNDLYEMWTTGKRSYHDMSDYGDQRIKTEEDKLIEYIAQTGESIYSQPKGSTLYSFIINMDQYRKERTYSLLALNTMFVPNVPGQEFLKDQIIKKAQVHEAKSKKYNKLTKHRQMSTKDHSHKDDTTKYIHIKH